MPYNTVEKRKAYITRTPERQAAGVAGGQAMRTLVIVLSLVVITGCYSRFTAYEPPTSAPVMQLYTPEGYTVQWWIFDDSTEDGPVCTIEYSVVSRNGIRLTHWKGPCQMFMLLFHGIQRRTSI